MKQIVFLPIILFPLTVSIFAQNDVALNQKQAVAIAEKFVAENGYTNKTPIKKKLILESGEKISNINRIIKLRFNLIEPYALVAFIKTINRESLWSVQFLYSKEKIEKHFLMGREVIISMNGGKVSMNPVPIAVQAYVLRHGEDGF